VSEAKATRRSRSDDSPSEPPGRHRRSLTATRNCPFRTANGVTDLFAALNLATGQVIHQVRPQHRAAEFKKFLEAIDRAVPAGLDVHVVLDNSSTHKTPDINKWVLAHPRFTFHFTPTSSDR